MPKLSIIIVNWNVAGLLAACIESLPEACGDLWDSAEVIVVDNASTDGSVATVRERFPGIRVIALSENRGFTGGNNAGIAASRGEYLLLLNPDTVAHPGSIAALAHYLDSHPEVGIAGPRLLNPDGTVQPSRRRFPSLLTALVESTPLQSRFQGGRLLRDFYMLDTSDGETQQVGWLSGAALMCRRTALLQSGFFDPGFFMFSEEVDLCKRVSNAGWSVVYLPESRITHFGGQSTGQDVPARHINFYTGRVRYFRLYEGVWAARLLRLYLLTVAVFQLASEAAKWVVGHKRELRASRVSMYMQVLRSGLRERRPRPEGVLLITGEYPPARGGVGDYTCRLRHALLGRSTRAKVLTRKNGASTQESRDQSVREVPTDARDIPLRAARITARAALRALRGERSRIAHIQYQTGAYELRPTINFLPLILRVLWGGRTVVTFHDLRVPYLFPKAGPLRTWTVRFMAHFAHAAIATNPGDAATLASWGIKNVRAVPIGSNIPNNPPEGYSRDVWRARYGAGPETYLLAYFGFLNSTKGLDDLLAAIKSLKARGDFRLLMVGGGLGSSDPTNRSTAARLAALASELGVGDRLLWTGYLTPREVSAALLSADMAVLPYSDGASFRRGSLLAVIEHGLPIVTTTAAPWPATGLPDLSGWPRIEDEVSALVVQPGDPRALARSIERLASDEALRARLSGASAGLARFFDWGRIAATHEEIYDSLR